MQVGYGRIDCSDSNGRARVQEHPGRSMTSRERKEEGCYCGEARNGSSADLTAAVPAVYTARQASHPLLNIVGTGGNVSHLLPFDKQMLELREVVHLDRVGPAVVVL